MDPTYNAAGSPYAANWNPQAYWGVGNVWGGQGGQSALAGNPMIQAIMSLLQGHGAMSGGPINTGGVGSGMSGGLMGGAQNAATPMNGLSTLYSGIFGGGGMAGGMNTNTQAPSQSTMHPAMLYGGMPGSNTNGGGMFGSMNSAPTLDHGAHAEWRDSGLPLVK